MDTGSEQNDTVLYVVDADASSREALCRLASSARFAVRSFDSVEQLVARSALSGKGCLLIDSPRGPEIKDTLRRRGVKWPVIVLCAEMGERTRREARASGADFLFNKPVDAQALFDAIAWVTDE